MLRTVQECYDCKRQFKRAQELKRHLKEKHEPWRVCPFSGCKFQWTRPDKIKHHITIHHQDMFTAEVMAEFRTLNGRKMVAFLDGFDDGHRDGPGARSSARGADVEKAPALHPSPSPSPPRDPSPP